jgi:hypothetical protein
MFYRVALQNAPPSRRNAPGRAGGCWLEHRAPRARSTHAEKGAHDAILAPSEVRRSRLQTEKTRMKWSFGTDLVHVAPAIR